MYVALKSSNAMVFVKNFLSGYPRVRPFVSYRDKQKTFPMQEIRIVLDSTVNDCLSKTGNGLHSHKRAQETHQLELCDIYFALYSCKISCSSEATGDDFEENHQPKRKHQTYQRRQETKQRKRRQVRQAGKKISMTFIWTSYTDRTTKAKHKTKKGLLPTKPCQNTANAR